MYRRQLQIGVRSLALSFSLLDLAEAIHKVTSGLTGEEAGQVQNGGVPLAIVLKCIWCYFGRKDVGLRSSFCSTKQNS